LGLATYWHIAGAHKHYHSLLAQAALQLLDS
jgi:hypothetical protein